MKRRTRMAVGLIALLLAALSSKPVAFASSPAQDPREEIRKLETERNDAIVHGDAAALERMTSDDYSFITLRGEMKSKADIVKGFASGTYKYDTREISDLVVRVYGNAAVVTGRSQQKGSEDGKDYSGDYRFTRVYVKHKGHWVTVALQATRVEAAP